MINLEDFQKIDLRVAEVLEAKPIDESNKLVKLQVSLGGEKRQILAGIKEFYQPADLIGRQIIIIANLAPRSMMGQQSEGMLLAASDGRPVLLQPEHRVSPGTKIN